MQAIEAAGHGPGHAVLQMARARGYRYAVLTASPPGFGVYTRLGFRTVCTVRRYVPPLLAQH